MLYYYICTAAGVSATWRHPISWEGAFFLNDAKALSMKRKSTIEQQPRYCLAISIPWELAVKLTEVANERGCTRSKLAREAFDNGLPAVVGNDSRFATPEA